jgi:predicted transcriptional regulator
MVVFGGAYIRVNAYRTRIHIYHEILQYVAESPRIPSHIMRRCNLETRKFGKYIGTLGEHGFVEKIHGDGERYKVTDKALAYLKDEKLSSFIKELP